MNALLAILLFAAPVTCFAGAAWAAVKGKCAVPLALIFAGMMVMPKTLTIKDSSDDLQNTTQIVQPAKRVQV